MIVRRASEADLATIHALYGDFAAENPPADYQPVDWDEERREIEAIVRSELAFLAEADGGAVGYALARRKGPKLAYLSDLYVVPAARRRGVARALVHAVASAYRAQEVPYLNLNVDAANAAARAAYARLGFREESLYLVAETAELDSRLASGERGSSFGSIHVQSDDFPAVERSVRQFVPRLPGASRGSIVAPPRNGWIAVYDDVCDRDPRLLRRLARELSDRLGAVVLALGVEEGAVVRFVLLDRGRVVDEYLSVQEYYGPLPPGDVVALAANATVVSRLTGADAARVREAARHAASPAELPPARELLADLAAAIGIEGAGHGWADAPEVPGAVTVERS